MECKREEREKGERENKDREGIEGGTESKGGRKDGKKMSREVTEKDREEKG